MNDMENMRTFADQLWKYMVPKLDSKFASNVSYFRAVVKTNLGNNMLEVERPLENGSLTLPCVTAMSNAVAGQQVVALVMGSMSNAIVVGDGKLNTDIVSTFGPASTVTLEAGPGGMPFKKMTAEVSAVQSGTGDPGPSNIRPITGWTGANIHLNDTMIPISWQTEAGTVYGGTLDVLTGLLTVDRLMDSFNSSETWGTESTSEGVGFYCNLSQNNKMVGRKSGAIEAELTMNWLASRVRNPMTIPYAFVGSSGNYLNIRKTGFENVTELIANLSQTPLQVVYPLATPITYQLSPTQISSLPGTNEIWSDTGDITVEYGQFLQSMQQEIENMA